MRTAAAIALRPFQRFCVARERALLRGATQQRPDHPAILVVGGPRTGTTFASQLLARYLDVSFFPNATDLCPESPIWATKKLSDPFAPAVRFDPHSFYGITSGLCGINDGFTIWNEWLGSDRYHASPMDEKAEAMRKFFANWSAVFGKPLLNKNNRNLDAMEWLAQELPHAVFVVIRREPIDVARSLITAREYIQSDKRFGWGLLSSDDTSGDALGYVDRVAEQLRRIDRRIEEQLSNIDEKRWLVVNYSDYCESPQEFIRAVAKLAGGVAVRNPLSDELSAPILFQSKRPLTKPEQARLNDIFAQPSRPKEHREQTNA